MSKVLTANKLIDGNSVWLNAQGEWIETIADAFIARHDEAVAALEETGKKAVSDNLVVDVAVIDVKETEQGIWPPTVLALPMATKHLFKSKLKLLSDR
jgi:hypothetical protein